MNIIGHKNISDRFNRYSATRKLNATINFRQFQSPSVGWPKTYRFPDVVYDESLIITIGEEKIHLFHDRGETDDATWVWMPNRSVICTGDLFIWSCKYAKILKQKLNNKIVPNCGNPQKSQRYCEEWSKALRKMEKLNAEILLPGHGPPISIKTKF